MKRVSNINKLVEKGQDPQFIEEVFEFAKETYGSKKMPWGEDYITHVMGVATILSQMRLDQKTIAAGILHDILEASSLNKEDVLKEVEKKFGQDVATMVERFSEVKRIYIPFNLNKQEEFFAKEKIENLRRMFLAISKDLRIVLIELAARIDRLNKIENFPSEKQKLYATETLQVFVPIANRLGLGQIKTTLEDLSFAYLLPDQFNWLKENIKEKYEERQRYLKKFIPRLKKIFKTEKIKFSDINYRAKSYWSTYQKLISHDMDFDRIHDLVAIRVIVPDIEACYKSLGIIHQYYKPISQEIDDYIAKPKPNGYKSLHTTVFLEENTISEIQIRTEQMQKEAEYGVCAHWSYKESVNLQKEGEKFNWINPVRKDFEKNIEKRSFQSPQKRELSNGAGEIPEFWKTFKIDFFSNQVFVFTPMGDVVSLPKGSTPVDFAYAIHSEIGNHCDQAKIDGKIIPLSKTLNNGDVVEIILDKKRKPSRDWLKFVKTNIAKSNIKKATAVKIPISIFSIPSFITKKVFELSEKVKRGRKETAKIKKTRPMQIYLAGQKGMMVNRAKCCNPQPGDETKAYLTRYRAAVLHKVTCQNLQRLSQRFPEKVVDASWN